MNPFIYNGAPGRVVFGSGTLAELPRELERLGASRALVLVTAPSAERGEALARQLGERCAGVFAGARMHTPVAVTEQALAVLAESGADCLVALGGGSSIGLSKALALRSDLPQIVIPTTYAGSEMTPVLGETRDGVKSTLHSEKVRPEVVIYDVDLTLSLPVGLSGTSGLNAIAHGVEALYARDGNPVVSLMAGEGIASLAAALPRIMDDPQDRDARAAALYGAWLCSLCLGSVGMALHHKLCHVLGGTFELPHADTHALLLPYALAYNAPAVPEAMARLRASLATDDPVTALRALGRKVGARQSLAELGMPEAGIERSVELALANPYWNPRPLEEAGLRELVGRAYHGLEP